MGLALLPLSMFLGIAIAADAPAVRFDDFAFVQGLSLVGDARITGKVLRLTPARPNKSGAVWLREKLPVRSGFETTFQFQLTHQDLLVYHGADGFALVLQNSSQEALGAWVRREASA